MSDINPGFAAPGYTAGQLFAPYPNGSVPFAATSGNVANANAVATTPAIGGKTPYLLGVILAASGATTAVVVSATIAGSTATITIPYAVVAGVLLQSPTFIINFPFPGLSTTALNVSYVVTLPALGAGNTNAAVFAWGYNL